MKITTKMIRTGLTLLGLAGIPLTSWLSVRGHEKAKNAETKKDKIKCYIPAIISGTATGACIVGSHKVSSKEIAALTATATYAVANRNALEEKLSQHLPKEEVEEVKEKVAKASIVPADHVEDSHKGKLKVLEAYSGRLFWSSLEAVKTAEQKLNQRFADGQYVCMNDFYVLLGISTSQFGDQFGWVPDEVYYPKFYMDNPIGFENSLVDGDDGNPMLIISIYVYPMECWREV